MHLFTRLINIINSEAVYTISLTMLLVISSVLTLRPKLFNRAAVWLLALYFWAYTYTLLVVYVFNFGYEQTFTHMKGTTQISILLMLPASYFYVLQTLRPRKFRYPDLLHLLPLAVFLLDYLPFFLLPAQEKLSVIARTSNGRLLFSYKEGLFMPAYGHIIIRYSVILVYFIAQALMIKKTDQPKLNELLIKYPNLLKWIKLLVGSQFILFFVPLITALFPVNIPLSVQINVINILIGLAMCYYLIFHPNVLYGVVPLKSKATVNTVDSLQSEKEDLPVKTKIQEVVMVADTPDYTVQYSDEIMNEIGEVLDNLMKTKQPYLAPQYGLNNLSSESGISTHKISAYVNRRMNTNFNHYINEHRVQHFIFKLKSNEHRVKTMEAMARECGFKDRGTFIRAFKKVTQYTPTEYIRNLKPPVL